VAVWSPWTHNAEYGLDYRFGVTRTETLIGDTVMWDAPWMVLEVRNVGEVTRRLRALGPGGPTLTCNFYAAGKDVGYYPVVGDAMEDAIDLLPGETLRRVMGGMWSLKDPGQKDVQVGFRVVVPGHDPVELRTAPIAMLFKKGDARKQGD
jgi:hypothetical protein